LGSYGCRGVKVDTRGSIRGEVGQTQFMSKNILAYGTGNLDVAANAISSTANILRAVCTESPIRVDDVTESPKLAE
jgi:membrane-bound lytic murein transglycosylase B